MYYQAYDVNILTHNYTRVWPIRLSPDVIIFIPWCWHEMYTCFVKKPIFESFLNLESTRGRCLVESNRYYCCPCTYHMWSTDSYGISNALWSVCVWITGAVMSSVHIHHRLIHSIITYDTIGYKIINKMYTVIRYIIIIYFCQFWQIGKTTYSEKLPQ